MTSGPRPRLVLAFAALVHASVLAAACSSAAPPGVAAGGGAKGAREAGRVACGATSCAAGTEVCCADDAPRCAPAATKTSGAATGEHPCGGHTTYRACDDAGDCKAGETCCRQRDHLGDGEMLSFDACVPLAAGRVACTYEERCSADEPRCLRKGSACRAGACVSTDQARPACVGGRPCPTGELCVENEKGRRCAPERALGDDAVVACNGGADCGEGESCIVVNRTFGSTCAYRISGIDPTTEHPICREDEDCDGHCGAGPHAPRCLRGPPPATSACWCGEPCKVDADCSVDAWFMAKLAARVEPAGEAWCASGFCARR